MTEPDPRAALEDIVFLALSRPAMLWGCPAEGVMLNLTGSVVGSAWLGMGSWHELVYMLVSIPVVHMIMRIGVARDYNWFRVMKLGIDSKGYGTATWGGSTVTPIPHGMPARARDLACAF